MRGLLAVAERELRERKMVLAAALVGGLLPLAIPLLPWLSRHSARETRGVTALVVAASFGVGLALAFGASMIARDLRERRLGFYFARPLSAAAIFFGKLVAGLLLVLGAIALALLPATVLGSIPGVLLPPGMAGSAIALTVLAGAFLLLVAHAAAVSLGSRSPLALLDVALLIAVAAVVVSASNRLATHLASTALMRGSFAFDAVALAGLVMAGFAQVSLGRTDPRRGHRALSLTLWSTLGAAAVAFAAYGAWVLAASPNDLRSVDGFELATRGNWLAISGRAWGRGDYQPVFLLQTASGRFVRVGAGGPWMRGATFSTDGRRAAWLGRQQGNRFAPAEVVTLDLAEPDARPVTTTISIRPGYFDALTLSADGRRLAVREEKTLSVFDLPSEKQLVSVRLPENVANVRSFFLLAERLRILGWPEPAAGVERADLRVLELDVAGKRLVETGRIPDVSRMGFFSLRRSGEGDRLVLNERRDGRRTVTLYDGRTGALLAKLTSCEGEGNYQAMFLADGRVVLAEGGQQGTRVRLFSPAGKPDRVFELAAGRRIRLGGEASAGSVVVSVVPERSTRWSDGTAFLVDLTRGTSTPLGRGYQPLASFWWLGGGEAPEPGSVASRALIGPDGTLSLLDPSGSGFRTLLSAHWFGE